MLAISPCALNPNFVLPLEEAIGHRETDTDNPISWFPNINVWSEESPLSELHQSTTTADPNMIKKLNHNASERDRRKKMNSLYSSLRSLLPPTDQMKKLSIPATVSRMLKYIPELQIEVERLAVRKQKLISIISKQDDQLINHQPNQRKSTKHTNNSSLVSTTQLGDTEVVIQISTYYVQTCLLSEILLLLEEEGLSLLSSSSFESFGGRVFYILHLQVEGTYRFECEALAEKIVSKYDKREVMVP